MPCEKTWGFVLTATETTAPSSVVGILSLMRAATLNLVNLATMPRTGVGNHAWSATAETANILAQTTTNKIVTIIQVSREGTTRIRTR